MNVAWVQTRRFPERICWVGADEWGRVYRLRLTEVNESAVMELRRIDPGGTVPDRRDGWADEAIVPEGGIDAMKSDALAWANNTLIRQP